MRFRGLFIIAVLLTVAVLCGCAQKFPVPGGDDRVNETFYHDEEELKKAAASLQPGMTEKEVLHILGRHSSELHRLSRDEIVATLYGGNNAAFDGTLKEREHARRWLEELYGYRLNFKIVERDLGFSSPIRIKTHAQGFNYRMNLVFWRGVLFDKPTLSGGPVDDSSSDTLFDFINPFSWIGRPF